MKQRLRDLEARELWIEARVDELMDDKEFVNWWVEFGYGKFKECARKEAEKDYAEIEAMILDAQIDNLELKR